MRLDTQHSRTSLAMFPVLTAALVTSSALPQGSGTTLPLGPDTAADIPISLAVTPRGDEVLIAHRDSDNLTFFDVASNAAVATLVLGDGPAGVALGPSGRMALVANGLSADLSVIDVVGRKELTRVPLSIQNPERVQLAPHVRLAVVGGVLPNGTWSFSVVDLAHERERLVIDTTARTYYASLPMADGVSRISGSLGFALSPRGDRLVVSDYNARQVHVFDPRTGRGRTLDYPGGGAPANVLIDPHGHTAVFAHSFSQSTPDAGVAALDLYTLAFTGPFAVPSVYAGNSLALLPDGVTVAVSAIDRGVTFVDLASGSMQSVGGTTFGFEATGDGAHLASWSPSATEIIDTTSRQVVAVLPGIDTRPEYFQFMAASRFGSTVAWLDARTERVGVLEASGPGASMGPLAFTGEGVERDGPVTLALLPGGDRAVTLNVMSDNVSVVDLLGGTVLADHPVGNAPSELAVSPDGTLVLVSNSKDRSVSIIDLTGATPGMELALPDVPGKLLFDPSSQLAFVGFASPYQTVGSAVSIRFSGASAFVETVYPPFNTGIAILGEMFQSPDGQRLTIMSNPDLAVFDVASGQLLGSLQLYLGHEGAVSSDGNTIYTRSNTSNVVNAIDVSGAAPQLLVSKTLCDGDGWLLNDTDDYLYAQCLGGNGRVLALQASTLSVVLNKQFPIKVQPNLFFREGQELFVAGPVFGQPEVGYLLSYSAQGAEVKLQSTVTLAGVPTGAAYSQALGRPVLALPAQPDALEIAP